MSSAEQTKDHKKKGKDAVLTQCNMEGYIQELEEIYGKKLTGEMEAAIALFKESQHSSRSLNKLSFRRKCRLTPNADEMKLRELQFVNDGIITERRRTKYKDIIPPYDATEDQHSKGYFKRPDIKRLVTVTCSPRSPRVN